MSTPLPLPMRVLVKGASTVLWISWMGGPRTDFTFPRAIEQNLLSRGRPVEVRNTGILGSPTKSFIKTYEQDVAQWSPDVVIIVAGHYEVMHLFLPRWYERYSNRPNVRGWRLSASWRKRVVRPMWKAMATLQSKVDLIPDRLRLRKRRMQRAADDLRAYIQQVRTVGSPLVLVFELLPLAPNREHWFPGGTPRIHLWNRLCQEVIEGFGTDDVRYFRIAPLAHQVAGDDLEKATPDGYHYTPELHALVGAELAREIEKWADTQAHLTVDP